MLRDDFGGHARVVLAAQRHIASDERLRGHPAVAAQYHPAHASSGVEDEPPGSNEPVWADTNGRAGSTSIRPATASGAAPASRSEIIPPIELPMRITGLADTDSMKRCSSSRFAATPVPRPADWVSPCPARSGSSIR